MSSLIDSLKTHYDAVLQSTVDQEMYTNIYYYLDHIVQTPELSALITNESKRLNAKLKEIRNDSIIGEDYRQQLARREQIDSFYPGYMDLYMRIYLTIHDHARGIAVSDNRMLIIIHGIDALPAREERWKSLWERDIDSTRIAVKQSLERLHTKLLLAIERREAVRVPLQIPASKLPLNLDPRTGDFDLYGIKGSLTPKSQEYLVLKKLLDSESNLATYSDLIKIVYPTADPQSTTVRADLYKIILRLKEKMSIPERNPDIFANVKNNGYRLVFPDSNQRAE
jgi:hypothetical protein